MERTGAWPRAGSLLALNSLSVSAGGVRVQQHKACFCTCSDSLRELGLTPTGKPLKTRVFVDQGYLWACLTESGLKSLAVHVTGSVSRYKRLSRKVGVHPFRHGGRVNVWNERA